MKRGQKYLGCCKPLSRKSYMDDLIWSDQTCLDCVSSEIWEVRIPQKDFGCRFFLSALNSQPMLDSQAAHSAIVHVYLQQKKKNLTSVRKFRKTSWKNVIPWKPAVNFGRVTTQCKVCDTVYCNQLFHRTVRTNSVGAGYHHHVASSCNRSLKQEMNLSCLTLIKVMLKLFHLLQVVSPGPLQIQLDEMPTIHGSYAVSKSQLPGGF